MALNKNMVKYIRHLSDKKFRDTEKVFIAEGDKIIRELLTTTEPSLNGFIPKQIYCTANWLNSLTSNTVKQYREKITILEPNELSTISQLSTAHEALAIITMALPLFDRHTISSTHSLLLDEIQDPGNLGTIIRTADWFGIRHIFCTRGSADIFNPKTVQSTMGSIFRVNVHYTDTAILLEKIKNTPAYPVFGAFLNGENIYSVNPGSCGLIVLGNESKGISQPLQQLISKKITIPNCKIQDKKYQFIEIYEIANIIYAGIIRCQTLII
mgnify:CR=1 FL=1